MVVQLRSLTGAGHTGVGGLLSLAAGVSNVQPAGFTVMDSLLFDMPPPGSTSFINLVMKCSGEFFENVHSVSSFRKHIKLGQYNLASLSRQEEKKKSGLRLSSTLRISTLL